MSDSQQPAKNRRLSRRTRTKGHVKMCCYRGPWEMGTNVGVLILDLSETGIRIQTKEALAQGQEVSVVLEAPSNVRPVKRAGTVVWTISGGDGSYHCGINFQKRIDYRDYQNLT